MSRKRGWFWPGHRTISRARWRNSRNSIASRAGFSPISRTSLRTPLTLILAPLSELGATVTGAESRQQVRVIRRNAERLLGLINDLLDLSSLDAGGLRLNLAEMDIRSVAASVHENSTPAALAEGIDLLVRSGTSTQRIWGDAHRLEIVMTNLVSNAIKFTPRDGRIEIRIEEWLEVSRSRSRTPGWESRRKTFRGFSRGSSRSTPPIGGAGAGWGSVLPWRKSSSSCTVGPSASRVRMKAGRPSPSSCRLVEITSGRRSSSAAKQFEETADPSTRRRSVDAA